MNIIVARSAGFCFGVKRSIDICEKTLADNSEVYCIGQIIHNNDEVLRLSTLGLRTIENVKEIPDGSTVIIRAHGEKKEVISDMKSKGCKIVDATCPKVASIHSIADEAGKLGKKLVVFGDKNHPEVLGIASRAPSCAVIGNEEKLNVFLSENSISQIEDTYFVFQTTQTQKFFQFCEKKVCTNAKIFDTICDATQKRQSEASSLSEKCDAMIVVGGKHSANSRHLNAICEDRCKRVFFIESAENLDVSSLEAYDTIGITAGASVPERIIKEVKTKMCDEIKEVTAEVAGEMSFEEMLNENFKTIYNGETVKGIVVAISNTEVTLDLGTKHSAYIPVEDFAADGSSIGDIIHIGDTVEASVVRVNDVEGTVMLSKRRLDAVKNWSDLEEAAENKTVVEGKVSEVNKGGAVVTIKGIRVFVPASQTDLPKNAELEQLVGQTVRLEITEVNKGRKRVVGSIRSVASRERRERKAAFWNEIEVGKRYDGVVKSLTSYGAFVDIGGVDGMVHVSELSWKRKAKPSDIVAVGDAISVYVISFDKEKQKISLGYKNPNENPWDVFMSKYAVGDVADVRVVKFMTFGAFAEVVDGVDGLIHISQIADRRIAKADEVLAIGDVVAAKITAIDEENHKVSLSIRALSEPEAAPVADDEEVAEGDALVYEVSENGVASGIAPEDAE